MALLLNVTHTHTQILGLSFCVCVAPKHTLGQPSSKPQGTHTNYGALPNL